MNSGWGSTVSEEVDVQGFNYHYDQMDKFHTSFPQKPCFRSEVSAVRFTRGAYEDDKVNGYLVAYDYPKSFSRRPPTDVHGWCVEYARRPWLAGSFLWTGFDYGGEPKPFSWPNVISQSGALDYCGFSKDIAFYYQAWWKPEPVLHLLPHWNWPSEKLGKPIDVWCFTNFETVELLVNGKSYGVRQVESLGHAQWEVPYEPGTVEVRGLQQGKSVLSAERETTGAPTTIKLIPDRTTIAADGEDVVVFTLQIVDDRGRLVPTADQEVQLSVSGPGRLIAVGNGCPSGHGAPRGPNLKAFMGLAQAVVQASAVQGEIVVRATSSGLQEAMVTVPTRPALSRLKW